MSNSLKACAACTLALFATGCDQPVPDLGVLIQNGDPRACEASAALLESDIRSVPMRVVPRVVGLPALVKEDVSVTIRKPTFIRHDPTRALVLCKAEVAIAWAEGDHPLNDDIVWDEQAAYSLGFFEGEPVVAWEQTSNWAFRFPRDRYATMADQVHAAVVLGERPATLRGSSGPQAAARENGNTKQGSQERRAALPAQAISAPASGTTERRATLDTVGPVASPNQAEDQGGVVSRFTSIWPHDCTELANGGDEEDWVRYRCNGQGGLPVFLLFTDSARLSLGFGDRSTPFIGYRADREQNWPIEWRGRVRDGRFVVHGAIARMKSLDGGPSHLTVFNLRDTPCVVSDRFDLRNNEEARRLADTGSC